MSYVGRLRRLLPSDDESAAKEIKNELQTEIPGSAFASKAAEVFSNFSLFANNSNWDLWPYFASLGGATLLAPEDAAFARPWWLLTFHLVQKTLSERSRLSWIRNVVLFHALRGFKTSQAWAVRHPYASAPFSGSLPLALCQSHDLAQHAPGKAVDWC